MTLIDKLFIGVALLFLFTDASYSQDLLDYSNSLKYADYLFNTGQYDLAAIEFERVVYLEPVDTLAKLRLIRSYRYMQDYSTVIKRIEGFFPYTKNDFPEAFANEYISSLLSKRNYQRANLFLEGNNTLNKEQITVYQLGTLMMENQWDEAASLSDQKQALISKEESYPQMSAILSDALNIHYKSPALAASLSAIIPGSGKAYSGRWKDAIYSFLFISAGSYLTYRAFSTKGMSVSGVLWGTVTIGFYSADIYGSHKSARRYNDHLNESFTDRVESLLLDEK